MHACLFDFWDPALQQQCERMKAMSRELWVCANFSGPLQRQQRRLIRLRTKRDLVVCVAAEVEVIAFVGNLRIDYAFRLLLFYCCCCCNGIQTKIPNACGGGGGGGATRHSDIWWPSVLWWRLRRWRHFCSSFIRVVVVVHLTVTDFSISILSKQKI